MTPQSLAAGAAVFVSFVSGILASRGIISRETQDYLAGPETLAFLSVAATAVIGAWAFYSNRPHGLIQSAAKLSQVDAVVVKPKTASEIPAENVVASAEAAAQVPRKTPRRSSRAVPPAGA